MNEYLHDEYQTLAPGMRVQDPTGEPFGTIGETVGDYVELRGADQVTSYWISRSEFGEAHHEAVALGFPSDEIGKHTVERPVAGVDSASETGALHDQQARQRETMLEELAEQRAEMREDGRTTEEADDNVGILVEEELSQKQ